MVKKNKNNKKFVLCLSHELTGDMSLSINSSSRLAKANEVFHKEYCDYLVTTGWQYREDMDVSLAEIMARSASRLYGIKRNSILCIDNAKDTIGEAYFFRLNLYENYNISDLYIVSNDWHMPRVIEIFNFIFGSSLKIHYVPISTPSDDNVFASEDKSLKKFKNLFNFCDSGDMDSISDRIMNNHSLYKNIKLK